MRLSAEKLRWILLSGAVLLACALAAIFGLANYRAGKIWQRILARNGVNLKQETNGFTYSQSDGKRTIFTLHAAKAVPHGKGKWSLSDAVLVLYGKDGRTDRIYGNQFDYDQEAGVARAVGEVHMDLQAPPTTGRGSQASKGSQTGGGVHGVTAPDLSFTPGNEANEDPSLIHVRTSGLVYRRKLGVVATPERAEFRYGGLTCTSRGAEFDAGGNILRLLAEVQLEGRLREVPFRLTAAHADLDRSTEEADLLRPVLVSGERNARAEHAVLHMRSGGSLQTGDADGGVELRAGTQRVSAPRMHGEFSEENRPQHALLSGGVQFADTDARRPAGGSAKDLDLGMTQAGVLRTATAAGEVHLLAKAVGVEGAAATRQLRAQRAVADFAPTGREGRRSQLRTLHMTGNAEFFGESPATTREGAPGLTRVDADDLLTTFANSEGRTPEPQSMVGTGQTRLEQNGADGQRQLSTGDGIDLRFAERLAASPKAMGGLLEMVSATQTGHVVLRSWTGAKAGATTGTETGFKKTAVLQGFPTDGGQLSVGHAQQAVYDAAMGTLTLTGSPEAHADVYDGTTQLSAPSIALHEGTGDDEASGGVVATTGGEGETPATHAVAARAALLHRSGLSQFFGTDAQPARLWQGSSQVQAARLVLDGPHHALSARPEHKGGAIHAVFANAHAGDAKRPAAAGVPPRPGRAGVSAEAREGGGLMPEASRDAVEVRAAAMDYNDLAREATFSGDVRLRGAEGDITGDHGAAFLAPSAQAGDSPMPGTSGLGGKLERFAILGDVHLAQPGRTGAGEQLTYTADTNSFALTGSSANLPRIHDAQQGLVTGATLVFGAADSSIVVAGTPAAGQVAGQVVGAAAAGKGVKPTRVHTETDLKQQ